MPLKRHPDVIAAFKKPLKQDVTCNLENREGDARLLCALTREKRRELR
ncbi:hypothetical protein DES41_1086 [Pseudorhodoferax soli]|uniref:Uncharacterized protein n=1 Tax=Pseudorhodoferax soli TaxID=545864 RepID=A0A368XIQ5_9BURK|nr:hypothetical protein DES41_1086 [Pseudorhodoferax soli]